MSNILYRSMLSKVKALIKVELEHPAQVRAAQQWQLLFTVDSVQYIIGKGGVNTMFYQIGTAERVLCYPDELIAFLESYLKSEYQLYSVYSKDQERLATGIQTLGEAKKINAPRGSFIVGLSDGKKVRLYERKLTMYKQLLWTQFKNKG